MKKAIIYICFVIISIISYGKSFWDNPVEITAIEKAITANDLRLLGLLMDEWVTITIDNKANIYNKYQAQNIVKNILIADNEKPFVMQKIGKGPNNNSYFAIGTYVTRDKSYLLYFYLVYNQNRDYYLLKEIKID